MAGANDHQYSSSTIDSTVSVSAPKLEHTISMSSSSSSSSTPSSMGLRPIKSQYNQNHHHQQYLSRRLGPNQRGNSFNSKGGKRDGLTNQQRGFRHWNAGFNYNANARMVNSQRHNHHGFVNGFGFLGPPPLPYAFTHSTTMVNPPYVNINVNTPMVNSPYVNNNVNTPMVNPPYVNIYVNHPPPTPVPIPGYMLPFGYYGNAYFSEASNPSYCPPLPPVLSPVQSPPSYMDAMSGALTYNQPILPNSEALHDRILRQIEYYFSNENLVKDGYLKSLMDDEGWVPVRLIAGFRKVKAMTSDINLILRALQPSAVVEVQGNKMRKYGDWMNWVQNRFTDARSSFVTDISTGIQNIHLREKAGADALIADDSNCLHAQMKGSGAS
ncbi:la-related protein 1C-like [Telopea speciosissima]|uniref:la-related protein 1C-like n=1 Tax=Telopea speciosissima TaxID=54955 RepID=UPI001CC4BA6A|nr:la-related protein 1C-like [Telopea speciosissima]